MTLELLRGLGTLTALIAFCGICVWAYSGKRRGDFERAAQLPFADEILIDESPIDHTVIDESLIDKALLNERNEERS